MSRKGRLAAGLAAAILCLAPATAQQPVQTLPYPATSRSGNSSTTITTTNTFQLVFAAAQNSPAPVPGPGARHGCSIQNNGTHTMYVTEGQGVALSSLTNSWQVAAGNLFTCNFNGIVLTGEIDITGTSGDAFVATQF